MAEGFTEFFFYLPPSALCRPPDFFLRGSINIDQRIIVGFVLGIGISYICNIHTHLTYIHI